MHKDLFGSKIREALNALPEGIEPLACLDKLRAQFEPELARQAAHLFSLRNRSKHRIGNDLLPYLREVSVSQCTAPAIARYRAQRIARLTPHSYIWDCASGLGMESVHLAKEGLKVITSDLHLETLQMARANLAHHGFRAWTLLCDATQTPVQADGILIDPDRRSAGKRTLNPEAWSPSLDTGLRMVQRYSAGAIKLPPVWAIPESWRAEYDVQWISLGGELLESCVWTGHWSHSPGFEAIRLERNGSLALYRSTPRSVDALAPSELESARFLFDPDPSLAAAGLLGAFAFEHQMAPVAPRIGYLAGNQPTRSGMGQDFRILGQCPLKPQRVRKLLAEHDVGTVQVRLRGHRERPEDLEKRLKGPGQKQGHLAIARLDQHRVVFLIEPLRPQIRPK